MVFKKLKNYPKISILILHKNGEEILDNCLKSVILTKYPHFDIHLLLNSTQDRSQDVAKKYNIKIYKSRNNLGFAKGNNFLIKKTNSKYIVIMNNDVEVEPDWLNEMVNFAEKNNAQVCQPKILSLKNKNLFEYAGAAGGFIDIYGYPFCQGRIFNKIEEDVGQYDQSCRIFWACGSCMMVRRSILKKTGLFDEDFFMYAEELDLCWRINLVGGKIYYIPKSVIYHLGSYSINRENFNKQKEFLIHRNTFLSFLKNNKGQTIKKTIIIRLFMEIISGIIFPKKIIPIIMSFIWILKNKKKIIKEHNKVQNIRIINDKEIQKIMLKKSIAYLFYIKNKKIFKEIESNF